MSTTRAVTALAALIHDAQQRRSTAYGIALDVDRAQMLMSPETAAAAERVREALTAAVAANSELESRLLATETERDQLRAQVAEWESAAKAIRALHTDSPAGPCPVCVDPAALARGADYTVPYPCPTAMFAGAKRALPLAAVHRGECGSQCPEHEHTCRRSPGHQRGICRDEKQKGTESCTWDPGAALKFARVIDAEDSSHAARAECPSCAAPADATGCRIPQHRAGCPRAVGGAS
ncbi:hypothetical protein [Streptomyces niveus]|uniref:hypothetical protein n=1 Tax=Streptomyces niveus TaxID=193462 RepID=UPI00084C4334|nr:hypothetical protein [Streptomyces niveus]